MEEGPIHIVIQFIIYIYIYITKNKRYGMFSHCLTFYDHRFTNISFLLLILDSCFVINLWSKSVFLLVWLVS